MTYPGTKRRAGSTHESGFPTDGKPSARKRPGSSHSSVTCPNPTTRAAYLMDRGSVAGTPVWHQPARRFGISRHAGLASAGTPTDNIRDVLNKAGRAASPMGTPSRPRPRRGVLWCPRRRCCVSAAGRSSACATSFWLSAVSGDMEPSEEGSGGRSDPIRRGFRRGHRRRGGAPRPSGTLRRRRSGV